MKHKQNNLLAHMRIILAITLKDLREAVKNKTIITALVSALFVVIMYRYLPVLTNMNEKPALAVFDPGDSAFAARLDANQAYDFHIYQQEDRMENFVSGNEVAVLGVTLPANFDAALAQGNQPTLDTVTQFWVSASKITDLRAAAENELSRLAGQPIRLNPQAGILYPEVKGNPLGVWGTMSLVFVSMIIGLSLVPNLMLEEKNSKTIDALLVSPASIWDLVAGKTIAGLVFILLSILLVALIYGYVLLNPLPYILAALLGALFTVGLGLILGLIVENRGQLSMWVWILAIPLFVPAMFILLEELFPPLLIQIVRFLPTVALFQLGLAAFGQPVQLGPIAFNAAIVSIWTLAVLGVVAWRVRHISRAGSSARRRTAHENHLSTDSATGLQAKEPSVVVSSPIPIVPETAGLLASPQARPDRLQIVVAIAAKDLREALRNKILLGVILGAMLMVALNTATPRLIANNSLPTAIVYDPGRSKILRSLAEKEGIRLRFASSEQEVAEVLSASPDTRLGMVIPEDFDQLAATGMPITLDASIIHWANSSRAAKYTELFAIQFSQASGTEVQIHLSDRPVFPAGDTPGQPFIVSMLVATLLLTIGVIMTPLLLVEEKEAHTMEALMVSPATPGQIVSGKAVVGFIYGMAAALVVLLLNGFAIVNWWVALLGIASSLVFAVSIGLLIGAFSRNPTTVGIWGAMLLIVFLVGGLGSVFVSANQPLVKGFLEWFPSGVMMRMLNFAMVLNPPAWKILAQSLALVILSGGILVLATWQVRKTSQI
jgi:ABC-2 type transport system permease protein